MRRASLTLSLTKGVIDPDLSERVDLAHYYNSLRDGENVLFFPQGGFADRGGFELVSGADIAAAGLTRRFRRRLDELILVPGVITAPNGGTSANLCDQDDATKFTTTAVAASPFVVLEVDFATPQPVSFVDVIGFSAATTGVNESLAVEYYDGSAWLAFSSVLDPSPKRHIRTGVRTRRFGGWPGEFITAQHWRIVLYTAIGAGTVSIAGLRMWREKAHASPVALMELAHESANYVLALTERNIDVFRDSRWQTSIPVPVAAQQVTEINRRGSRDTVFLFHEQIETPRIFRQGSHSEWDVHPAPWVNVPDLPARAALSGDSDEIQVVNLADVVAGDDVILHLGNKRTGYIAYTSPAAFAAAMATALKTIPGVDGNNVVVASAGGGNFIVYFIGLNGSRSWPLVAASVAGRVAVTSTRVLQAGRDASGKLFGYTTGWPRCGAIAQSRLLLGGFRAAPSTLMFSKVDNFFDYTNTGSPLTADLAFMRHLDVDRLETIHEITIGGRGDIQLFTENGEWSVEARTLDATQTVNASVATRNGLKPNVPVAFVEGATVFMQKGGMTLLEQRYSDAEQKYNADALSILAPQLLTDVVDMSCRPARSVRDGNMLFMVNADGSMAVMTLLRGQEVAAMCRWSMAGAAFRAVLAGSGYDVFAAVEIGSDIYFMKWRPDIPLDGAVRVTGAGITEVTGLAHFNGGQVYAYADDDLLGPFTVAGGKITLPVAASDVTAGQEPPFRGDLQVVRERINNAQPFRAPMRIYELELALADTGGVAISTNGRPFQDVPLTRVDATLKDAGPLQSENGGRMELPTLQRLFTGYRTVQGLQGWKKHPYISIGRQAPVPVHVKAIRYEVATNG